LIEDVNDVRFGRRFGIVYYGCFGRVKNKVDKKLCNTILHL
jgi:hypothetical protein